MRVFDANPAVEQALAERDRLWQRGDVEHAYPHCWRCHRPVIFVATAQWFIAMDKGQLRERALDAVTGVEWFPAWGEERIRNMLATRPRLVHLPTAVLGRADPRPAMRGVQ